MDEARAQEEINKYKKFRKVDGATYRKVNQFLRKRTYITAREWALARLCTDFRTTGGAEMTFIGAHLPQLVPFMEDTYSPQAVNQARNSFKKKVRKSSATFFYGAMCGFFTTEELDDLLFEASEVARFLLEVESTTLDIDEEIDIEDRITGVMRSVGQAAKTVLKTRGMELEKEAGTHPAGEPVAAAGTIALPAVRPGAVRRGRKRKVREQPACVPAQQEIVPPVAAVPAPPQPVQSFPEGEMQDGVQPDTGDAVAGKPGAVEPEAAQQAVLVPGFAEPSTGGLVPMEPSPELPPAAELAGGGPAMAEPAPVPVPVPPGPPSTGPAIPARDAGDATGSEKEIAGGEEEKPVPPAPGPAETPEQGGAKE